MAHRNARLNPHGRLLLCRRIEDEGWLVKAAAQAAGVSRQTASKWRRRLALEGPAGLADRSSARTGSAGSQGRRVRASTPCCGAWA
jgi:transposase